MVINDGFIGLPLSLLARSAPEQEIHAIMKTHGLSTEYSALPIGVVLIRTDERLVLLDTGAGQSDFAKNMFGDYIGGLIPTLNLIGVSPETVTDVIYSHVHGDHLWGTSIDGRHAHVSKSHQ